MKNKPMPGFMIRIVFVIAIAKAFFSKEEQAETAEELLSISGSVTQIGIGLVFLTSVLTHAVFNIPMILSVPVWCFILAHIYHLSRIIKSEAKALL